MVGGQLSYRASLMNYSTLATTGAIFFYDAGNSSQLLAQSGAPAPGVSAGVTFSSFGSGTGSPAVLSASGAVAFWAQLAGPGITIDNNQIICGGAPSALQIVARTGAAAPDTHALYNTLSTPVLKATGQVIYTASLTTDSVTGKAGGALYAGDPTSPRLIARSGDPALGARAGSGVSYADFQQPVLNDENQIAFVSTLSGAGVTTSKNSALFAGPMDLPLVIARTGQLVPGSTDGAKFVRFSDWQLADDGVVAFDAFVSQNATSVLGLYAYEPTLGSTLIARVGDPFDIGDGVLKTIRTMGFSRTGSDKDPVQSVATGGRVAFSLTFTDGSSGIFLAHVPEPSLLGVGALLCLATLRKQRVAHVGG